MPDPNAAIEDKSTRPPEGEEKGAPAGADKAKPFLLDFKDADAATKGFKELQGAKTRAEQRAKELEEKLKLSQTLDSLNSKLDTIGKPKVDREQQLKELAEKLEEEGTPGLVRFVLENTGALENDISASFKEQLKAKDEAINALAKKLEDFGISVDPKYQSYKPMVDKLVSERGMSRTEALSVIEALGIEPSQPDPVPAGTGSARRADTERGAGLTDEDIKQMKKLGLTDAEIEKHKTRGRR